MGRRNASLLPGRNDGVLPHRGRGGPWLLCRYPWTGWGTVVAGMLGVLLLAFAVGKFAIAPGDLVHAVRARISGETAGVPTTMETVLWHIRLPRILSALLVGAALSAAGAAYQAVFRNPLVSPDILGASSGAGLGAVLAIWLGWPMVAVQGTALLGGLLAVAVVIGLVSLVRHHDSVLVLVLAGVAVSALLGAGIALIKTVADPLTQLPSMTFWLMGGLGGITMSDMCSIAPVLLVGLLPMLLLRWRVNLLGMPDDEAAALGVSVVRLRLVMVVAATLSTAAAVSAAGVIGWVGLVMPHVARMLAGPDFGRLLPASLLMGGGFLVLADTLARTMADIELPLGIVTAMVGAPFFLFLLAREGRAR